MFVRCNCTACLSLTEALPNVLRSSSPRLTLEPCKCCHSLLTVVCLCAVRAVRVQHMAYTELQEIDGHPLVRPLLGHRMMPSANFSIIMCKA